MKISSFLVLFVCASLVNFVSPQENIAEFLEMLGGRKMLDNSVTVLKNIKLPEDKDAKKFVEKFIVAIGGAKTLEVIEKFAKIAGPVGDAVALAIALFAEAENDKFQQIDTRFDLLDEKLDELSDQVRTENTRVTVSMQYKVINCVFRLNGSTID